MVLNKPLPSDNDPKPLGLAWLNELVASPRNWKRNRSWKVRFLNRPRSTRSKPGPRTTPRPAFPGICTPPAVFTFWKQAALNQLKRVWGALAFGSQTISGRGLEALDPMMPSPAGSVPAEVITVFGAPVLK